MGLGGQKRQYHKQEHPPRSEHEKEKKGKPLRGRAVSKGLGGRVRANLSCGTKKRSGEKKIEGTKKSPVLTFRKKKKGWGGVVCCPAARNRKRSRRKHEGTWETGRWELVSCKYFQKRRKRGKGVFYGSEPWGERKTSSKTQCGLIRGIIVSRQTTIWNAKGGKGMSCNKIRPAKKQIPGGKMRQQKNSTCAGSPQPLRKAGGEGAGRWEGKKQWRLLL